MTTKYKNVTWTQTFSSDGKTCSNACQSYWSSSGGNSPFVDGKLKLKENSYGLSSFEKRAGFTTARYKPTGAVVIDCFTTVGGLQTSGEFVRGSGIPNAKLLSKLLSAWRESEFNLGVTVGEGRESVNMIINRLNSLRHSWRSLRRFDLGGALRHLAAVPRRHRRRAAKRLENHDVSGSWLELHLGWVPLLGDIYNAADFEVEYENTKRFLRVRSGWDNPGYVAESTSTWSYSGGVSGGVQWKAFLDVQSSAPSLPERLGLTDPATIAWELVPMSFVVDWFVPIGTALEAYHAAKVVPVSTITQTQFNRGNYTKTKKYSSSYTLLHQQAAKCTSVLVSRSVNLAVPGMADIVASTARRATVTPIGTLARLGTSFALFHQRFGR